MNYAEEMFSLTDEIAIVTGGAGVLPSAMATTLLRAGARVALWGRGTNHPVQEAVDKLVTETGVSADRMTAVTVDTADEAAVEAAFDQTVSDLGMPTILVNGVGGNRGKGDFVDIDVKTFEEVVSMNLLAGLVIPLKVCARRWIDAGQTAGVINLASMTSYKALSGVWAYNAAKSAVLNLTEGAAKEFAPHGIRVNGIAPGFFPRIPEPRTPDRQRPDRRVDRPWPGNYRPDAVCPIRQDGRYRRRHALSCQSARGGIYHRGNDSRRRRIFGGQHMKPFMNTDFLLNSETARELYHEYAQKMPIFDFHCHLPPGEIDADQRFENLGQIWLGGDHYKWRAMRSNGVDERFVTGDASWKEKFDRWAETVPRTIGNPLYHWTHLELQRYFDIAMPLGPDSADTIWNEANARIATPEFSVRTLLTKMNVRYVGTTDDPTDDLRHHKALAGSDYPVVVRPSFRPDKAYALADPTAYTQWLAKLAEAADLPAIETFADLREALRRRIDYFADAGCVVSDHALTLPVNTNYTEGLLNGILTSARRGGVPDTEEADAFATAVLEFVAREYAAARVGVPTPHRSATEQQHPHVSHPRTGHRL